MKSLDLESKQYNYLVKNFREWLDILGYAETTLKSLPVHVRELLHYLENQQGISSIRQVKAQHIYSFNRYLQSRRNHHHGGALSSSSINKTLQAIATFVKYLNAHGHHYLDVHPQRAKDHIEERVVLTTQEIKALYEATYETERGSGLAYGQRDRAMLAVFYGCGLRKNEGLALDKEDVHLEKSLILVRKGKGNKERFVPIAHKGLEDLLRYLEEGRYWFMEDHKQSTYHKAKSKHNPIKTYIDQEALFINNRGKRMGYNALYIRLQKLKERAGINKALSPHVLRHSIATHLLQSGMNIQEISRFLGHSSLESTQIYTHMVNELKEDGTNDFL